MTRLPKFIVVFVVPAVIIAIAAGAAAMLVSSRESPERKDAPDRGTLVEAMTAQREAHNAEVEAKGTVRAARSVAVQPQLSGRVVWINDQLVPGGLIEKGEPLFRIEARDYQIAVDQRETGVDQASAQLRIEAGQQRVAKKEWELFRDQIEDGSSDPSLALREPQRKVAEVSLKAAESQLEKAKLDLSRTTVRAPFNLMVDSENLEIGQVVGPQFTAATVVGTDAFWIQVSVPIDRLEYVGVPGMNATEGSLVVVENQIGTKTITRQGRVAQLLGQLDPAGRMARVLVEVQDPLNLAKPVGERGLPLLLGAFTTVRFTGAQPMEAVQIPRSALREGDKIFVFDDGTLDIREVGVIWKRDDNVLLSTGVKDGEQIVTSRISTPLPGMKLRLAPAAQETKMAKKPEAAAQGAGSTTGAEVAQ